MLQPLLPHPRIYCSCSCSHHLVVPGHSTHMEWSTCGAWGTFHRNQGAATEPRELPLSSCAQRERLFCTVYLHRPHLPNSTCSKTWLMETHFQSKALGEISRLPKQLGVMIPPQKERRKHQAPKQSQNALPAPDLALWGCRARSRYLSIYHPCCDSSEITVGPALTFPEALW